MAKRKSKDVPKDISADWPAGVTSATLNKMKCAVRSENIEIDITDFYVL